MGIYLCLKYYVQPGQKVICSPYTLAEVINMIVCSGGEPFFVDVERETGSLDPASLPEDSANVAALLVTHLHGIPADMDPILQYAGERGIPVLEDAAQSAGTRYDGRFVGTLGAAGVISSGILKQLNSIYGGTVLTDDDELEEFLRIQVAQFRKAPIRVLLDKLIYLMRLHTLGRNPLFSLGLFPLLRYGVTSDVAWINRMVTVETDLQLKQKVEDWYRHRMTSSQARMLAREIDRLGEHDKSRIEHAEFYLNELSDIKGLIVPTVPPGGEATFAHFPVQVDDAPNLLRWFNHYGQDVVCQHFHNCAELACFAPFSRSCPTASQVAKSLILLPTYPGYGTENVKRNCKVIRRYFEKGQPSYTNQNLLEIL